MSSNTHGAIAGAELDILLEGGKMEKFRAMSEENFCHPLNIFWGGGEKCVLITQTMKKTNVTNQIFSKSTSHLI